MAIFRYNPGANPPATLALIAMNIVVAVVDAALDGQLERMLSSRGFDVYCGEWWRIPGCAVVHADPLHLAFNCYGIWVLGRIFERLQGWHATLVVYVVSALGGAALGTAFTDPAIQMLGASGAAYGLMGAVLGYYYVKTGSVRGVWAFEGSRQLAIWFLIGVAVSLRPGISLLGHVGGFVPGALLGIYYEYRYERRADIFHHLSVAALVLMVVGFCAYAAIPWHRGNWYAARAIHAYSDGDLNHGDALVREARSRGLSASGAMLATHLELWRKCNAENPKEFNDWVLHWPLLHSKRDERLRYNGAWDFLTPERITEGKPDALDRPSNEP